MVARKGEIRAWSFAHQVNEKVQCDWAAETAIHFAMKEIIAEQRQIFIPDLRVTVSKKTSRGELLQSSAVIPGRLINLESVELEYSVHPIRPDVVAISQGKRLFIEVKVTHGVDDEKLRHIRKIGASVIQIDLSKANRTVDRDYLKELLLTAVAEKSWIFHRKRGVYETKLLESLEQDVQQREQEYLQRQVKTVGITVLNTAELGTAASLMQDDFFMPDGAVMCFRFESGGEAFLKRSSNHEYLIEFVKAEEVRDALICASGLSIAGKPSVLCVSQHSLVHVIPLLNKLAIATTNRSKNEYLRYRYGDQ
ncbi:hypothetical protein [Paucimonas lemoignei]|nr:hypothetical protein [Paucimonas lemoignei]